MLAATMTTMMMMMLQCPGTINTGWSLMNTGGAMGYIATKRQTSAHQSPVAHVRESGHALAKQRLDARELSFFVVVRAQRDAPPPCPSFLLLFFATFASYSSSSAARAKRATPRKAGRNVA